MAPEGLANHGGHKPVQLLLNSLLKLIVHTVLPRLVLPEQGQPPGLPRHRGCQALTNALNPRIGHYQVFTHFSEMSKPLRHAV